jgi:uncharacterized protein (TIGR02145 family)
MKKNIILFALLSIMLCRNYAQTLTDIDGNIYNTVTIGTQIWMKENLKVTHYSNGNPIPILLEDTLNAWYCPANSQSYGATYNWFVVNDSRKLCPQGWHIPDTTEWNTLISYLGGDSIAGGEMKDTGTTHWFSPNTGATNSSGFTALGAGICYDFFSPGQISTFKVIGAFWSSVEINNSTSRLIGLRANSKNATISNVNKDIGISVRCISDSTIQTINEFNDKYDINIYPNPATESIIIDNKESQNLHITVYNLLGKIVLQREFNESINEIDIRCLSKGLFIIKISNTEWIIQKKLIKE